MAGAGAGAGQGSSGPQAPGMTGGAAPRARSDWANLPADLLGKVAETLVAQNEAGWAAQLREWGWPEGQLQERIAKRKRDGNCLFVFARVCKQWRKAQLKVGGPLRTRVKSDVLLPGQVGLAKWALAEGCPRENEDDVTMAHVAADYGHMELVRWLIQEQGFAMDSIVMWRAARGGNLELVRWLRGEGCPWNRWTCYWAVIKGHEEVLRWVRENGCPWKARVRDWAAVKLKYTDDFGNLVEESDDESDLVDLASEESDAEDASEANLLGSEQEDGHGWSQESPLYGPPLWTLYSGD